MIELRDNTLYFSFPDVHGSASLYISFQKTLRIPDDDKEYPLPPGLGDFPIEHVDDHLHNLPEKWKERGGVMLPMYQSEAMWIKFSSSFLYDHDSAYPFAVKIAAGKINAVTGEPWSNGLSRNPQDYMVIPDQPWLDGYCVEKGIIRQFVAMPLGEGYSAEEQITKSAETGGLQIEVYPMKRSAFEKRFPKIQRDERCYVLDESSVSYCLSAPPDMALAPGGKMRQDIYEDEFGMSEWDLNRSARCFVHLTNSEVWKAITGKNPPSLPLTARDYSDYGMPWFEYYSESKPLPGAEILGKLKSITEMGKTKRIDPLPENESADPQNIVHIRKNMHQNQVREWMKKE